MALWFPPNEREEVRIPTEFGQLDELIRSLHGARNTLMDLETLSDADLDKFQKEFERLRRRSENAAEEVESIRAKTRLR